MTSFSASRICLLGGLLSLLAVPLACGKNSSELPAGTGGEGGEGGSSGETRQRGSAGAGEPEAPLEELGMCGQGCSGETPICDSVQGCVQCRQDAQCASSEICHSFSCLEPSECESNADCGNPGLPACDKTAGRCRACEGSDECGLGFGCDALGQCIPVALCKTTKDCSEGSVCDEEAGFCVYCLEDADCGEGSFCHQSECVPECDSSESCGVESPHCDTGRRVCIDCLDDSHCEDDYFCSDEGTCTIDNCQQGESRCSQTDVVAVCSADGSRELELRCQEGMSCQNRNDEVNCQSWFCNPGQSTCDVDGEVLRTCDESGLVFSAMLDCQAAGGRCVSGACVDVVCSPGTEFCENGDSYRCNNTGTSFSLVENCGLAAHCSGVTGECESNICVPSATDCDGEVQRRCNALGSGYLGETTDCEESGRLCRRGACQDVVCDFGSRCTGSVLESCVDSGTKIDNQDCPSYTHCSENEDGALCLANVCTPGAVTCEGDVVESCNADGSAFLPESNCSQANMTCFSDFGCGAQVGDVSPWVYLQNSSLLNQFEAKADSVLHFVQVYSRSVDEELRWLVYESLSPGGPYTKVFDALNDEGSYYSQWTRSPDLNQPLIEGRYYLVGIHGDEYYGIARPSFPLDQTVGSLEFQGSRASLDPVPIEPELSFVEESETTAFAMRLFFK